MKRNDLPIILGVGDIPNKVAIGMKRKRWKLLVNICI